ncbi:hypothetical protein VB773_07690 [Haloarculaceae archaeon H-GB2-1]|nr:hypothetical protein [Haloarculaceae archaeon H-GB2-1]
MTAELSLPANHVTIEQVDEPGTYTLTATAELPKGEFLLECRLDAGTTGDGDTLETYARFGGPATVQPHDERVTLSFPEEYYVIAGVSHPSSVSDDTIRVPGTPAGLATALTHSSVAHHTTGPARSHPALRDQPPMVEAGSSVHVPESVRERTPESDIEFVLPDRLDALFVAAPLAYYLGADVSVESGVDPTLAISSSGTEHRFPALPEFQQHCADTLRKTFFLDCLVRDVDVESPASKAELLSRLSLHPDRLRAATPAERLDRYLDVPDGLVWPSLPDWHLSTYAMPEPEHVPCLPYLLDSLSLVYLPKASKLEETELLDRTLDDAYRAPTDSVRSVNVLVPELQAGRVHAWLAPGTSLDTFKLTPNAYRNRNRYSRTEDDSLEVSVVLNDGEMSEERTKAAEIYRDRAADLPINLSVHESLTTNDLRSVFAEPNDFVHYIGHCEESGLCCADGNLSLETLEESKTRTFFLNACGSYHEGLTLVEKGSVAGAVTLTKVLDRHAAKVGTAFARLLMHGFEIERAMQLARRRILMGKDYAVVGDGTYSLLPVGDPGVIWLDREDDTFELAYEVLAASTYGESYSTPFDDTTRLHGKSSQGVLDGDELVELLEATSLPVIYENEFHWSDELAAKL